MTLSNKQEKETLFSTRRRRSHSSMQQVGEETILLYKQAKETFHISRYRNYSSRQVGEGNVILSTSRWEKLLVVTRR